MALEDILNKIELDARNAAEAILSEARVKEKELLAAAEKDAAVSAKAIAEEMALRAAKEKMKILSETSMKAKLLILKEKQALLSEAFERAVEGLSGLDKNSYLALLEKMISKAAQTGEEEIVVSKDDERVDEQFIKGKLKLTKVDKNLRGGFISKGKDVQVDMTFPSIVTQMKPSLESAAARILFSI